MRRVYGDTDFEFQSTLSMRRATLDRVIHQLKVQISIHALHEESDYERLTQFIVSPYFNPRSP